MTNGVVTKYYHAGSTCIALRTDGVLYYLLSDHLCSTALTTDASGNVISELRYAPWGETRYNSGTTPTHYQYTGQYSHTAEFGLYFYREASRRDNARWYDPTLGRFAQADTLIPEQSQGVQAWDRYAYVNNNPLRYTDPSGHWLETAWDIFSIGLDLYTIRQEGLTWQNGLALAVDVTMVILPGVPAFAGVLMKGGKAAKTAVEVATHADEVADAAKVLSHADEAVDALRGLERFKSIGREGIPAVLEAYGDAVRPMREIPSAFEGRRVTTLGRTWDIEAAKESGGFRVLDDPKWSIERNYEWLREVIGNGDVFYLASPVTEATLKVDDPFMKYGGISVFTRELDLLLQHGYRRVGDYLIPPR